MHRHVRRLLGVPVCALTAALLLAGCGGSGDGGEERTAASKSAAPTARPMTLEALGKAVGCTTAPKEAGKTLDFRQGVCGSADAEYVLLTFDTTEGQRGWLDTAQMYGGVYLVGNRWVLSADPRSEMEKLRKELGGTVEDASANGLNGASPSAG
ncbi:hypothetical protein [Streptomyces griseoruber]|uniref:Lipoprotein n=1 Tax=Streptomyces griseoruber TaxID=1943 RepID=A0A117R9Z6_9ACTN|nr:hypothetical protein [Streptomyces griseoruber]KUN79229.1 hypothetical protein AQJ64_29600 [Streptomyces griseoruber]